MVKQLESGFLIKYEIETEADIEDAKKLIKYHQDCKKLCNRKIDEAIEKGNMEDYDLWEDELKFESQHVRALIRAIRTYEKQNSKEAK